MLIKQKVSLNFIKYTPTEKAAFGLSVTNALSNHAGTFPDLPVPLSDLATATSTLVDTITASKTGTYLAFATLNNHLKIWNDAFRKTAVYVDAIANNSEKIILSAGFTPTKGEKEPSQKLGLPQKFMVNVDRGKGVFSAGCAAMDGALAYLFTAVPEGAEVTHDGNLVTIAMGDAKFYIIADTHRRVQFKNMPSGKLLHASVLAINRAGSGPAADSQPVIPQ